MSTAYSIRYSDWLRDRRGVGVRIPVGARIFSSLRRSDRLWGPPSFLSNGYWGALSPRLKRQGHEADYTPQTNAEVKKMWIYTFTPYTPSWSNT
jgi:hypothetical protein